MPSSKLFCLLVVDLGQGRFQVRSRCGRATGLVAVVRPERRVGKLDKCVMFVLADDMVLHRSERITLSATLPSTIGRVNVPRSHLFLVHLALLLLCRLLVVHDEILSWMLTRTANGGTQQHTYISGRPLTVIRMDRDGLITHLDLDCDQAFPSVNLCIVTT